ncbi:MAG: hypothetical protein WHV67_03755 [Thermoanaerobaculia bacterium]
MLYLLFFLTLFGVSFAFIESSVVIYLRNLYYPEGPIFPLKEIPENILLVEVLREFSTLVLIFSSSLLAGRSKITKIASFFYVFGIWDIFYYIFLYPFLKWPKSIFDWDILFLIPFPWVSPVYAPVLCSLSFIIFSIFLYYFWKEGYPVPVLFKDILFIFFSFILILFSFFSKTKDVLEGTIPEDFPHLLFFSGLFLFNFYWIYKLKKIHLKYSNKNIN